MKILLGTKNLGKINEFVNLLKEGNFEIIYLGDLGHNDDEPVENGNTYYDNALIKAKFYYEKYHIPCLCDDSGLEVEALNGAPGIKSARFKGQTTDAGRRIALLKALEHVNNRQAQFVTNLVFYDGSNIIASTGKVAGIILKHEQGEHGFGYDPIFYIDSLNKTTAELTLAEKNMISHRSLAVKAIKPKLISHFNYLNHLKNLEDEIISNAKKIYQTNEVTIVNRLSGGMSNYTYVIMVNDQKKVFRMPGENAEKFVDRRIEQANLDIVAKIIEMPPIEYLNLATGIKITPYVEGVSLHTTDDFDYNDIANILKRLHNSNFVAINDYQPFARIELYESFCRDLGYKHPVDYEKTKNKLLFFKSYLESFPKVLCHGDGQRSNFIKKDDNQIMLVDYEFTGNNDYFYDIACFGNREFEKGEILLKTYLGREASLDEKRRLILWHAFQALQWYNVAIFKDLTGLGKKLGFDFGLIANRYLQTCDTNCNLALNITKTIPLEK